MLTFVMDQQSQFQVKIKTANIVAKTAIQKPFSLATLAATFPYEHTWKQMMIRIQHQPVKFTIYITGTVVSRAAPTIHDLSASFAWLRAYLATFGLALSEAYQIMNIVAVAHIAPPLNLSELAPLLSNASYDPLYIEDDECVERVVDAIVYYFSSEKPRKTALIVPTGRVTLTGFTSIASLNAKANALSSLLLQLAREQPEILAS